MACSLTISAKSRFEPRPSTITLRIEGAKAVRRKLVGTLDLAIHASAEHETSTKVTIPLEHGAGSITVDLTAGMLKKSTLGDDLASEASSLHDGSDDGSVSAYDTSAHGGVRALASLQEEDAPRAFPLASRRSLRLPPRRVHENRTQCYAPAPSRPRTCVRTFVLLRRRM